jgi:membrane-anchored protein YejM (alkaline phosphatase superfamily)
MKYQVGDLLLVKDCAYRLRRPRFNFPLYYPISRHLFNTFGIITKINNHNDVWENKSSEKDNVYFWFSQTECREYYFIEEEMIGEVYK